MTITVSYRPVIDGRRYVGLPKGIQPWFSQVTGPGDASGGNLQHVLQFNPDSDNTFQPYVSVCRATVDTNLALSGGVGRIYAEIANWEKTPNFLQVVYVVPNTFQESCCS